MIETILFYISEYTAYILIFISILIAIFFLAKSSLLDNRQDKIQIIVSIAAISYIVLFTGIGGFIKPYFTNTDNIFLDGNYKSLGTGGFISPNIIITNRHVVYGCNGVVIKNNDNVFEGKILATSKKYDLAFIETNAYKKDFLLINAHPAKIGDILTIPNYTSVPGKFSKIKAKIARITINQIYARSVKGRKGNSGSPALNSKGYLTGIVSGGEIFSTNATIEKIENILEFAKESDVELFSLPNQDFNFMQDDDFLNKVSANILCKR